MSPGNMTAALNLAGANHPVVHSARPTAMTTERRGKPDPATAAAAPRKRALVSCDRCKLRRARCIRDGPDEPCADCKASGTQCESKLPRKQRVYGSVETLSLRYRALESLVKGLFPQENTQDVNVLFNIAAARSIKMPAPDDYTPAEIFSNSGSQQQQATLQHEQQQQQSDHRSTGSHQSYQTLNPSRESAHYVEPTQAASSSRNTRVIPCSTLQRPTRDTEELISARHGTSHYFGPSSSFRLASTIQTLVARFKAISRGFPPQFIASTSSHSDPGSRSGRSTHGASTCPSDEEYPYIARGVPKQERVGRKRTRAQMEETSDQWEHRDGSPNPDIIGDLLPSRSLADALVAAYFDHIHVYLPLFHRSMFHFRLEATYSRKTERLKDCADIGWLVVLALVFSFGCQQLHEHDPEQAHKLRLKYLGFSKSYFRPLLLSTSLVNVQALVLLSMHHHTVGQKSSSCLLVGLAARMAIIMGMHQDGSNLDFDPVERNTRRQVFWSICTFEKILCSIFGHPSIIDDGETLMQVPDALMLDQSAMSADFMATKYALIKMSYSIRQRAYFDRASAEERSPSLGVAESLLRECDAFFATMPASLTLEFSPLPPDERARVLLLHFYYYYTRCIVSRDFLIQKVERNICCLESKLPPPSEDWPRTLLLSGNCVDAAHQSLNCLMAGAHLGLVGYSWLDLFFVSHSVLIVCADFLGRPQHQLDSPTDVERKVTVRAVLAFVNSMKRQTPTHRVLSQVAAQLASITGVTNEEYDTSHQSHSSAGSQPSAMGATGGDGAADILGEISDVHDDWFANATMDLGSDFLNLYHATRSATGDANPRSAQPYMYPATHSVAGQVDDWTARTLRGMHAI
ncbi:hypothetical protein NX059_005535 [Plenodomus lindquistii]|nr:hypothetical protein NX059_005535 [Plenodomus lindquistii]